MAVHKHSIGGFRAYKKINGVEYQLYSFDENEALKMQADLDAKSKIMSSLKSPKLFSKCGRLIGLRVRQYKKTNRSMFQLQVSADGKQKKTERIYKNSFEFMWKMFITFWREHFNLSVVDVREYKVEMKKAKRLYMQDIYNFENKLKC
jgi:hypothetical protein